MAAISKLTITNVFADETTLKITIDNIKPENITSGAQIEAIRARCKQFNNEQGGTLSSKLKSKNGFNWIGIKAAQITTTNKVVIF